MDRNHNEEHSGGAVIYRSRLKTSPMPWSMDELNNIYDADGKRIFEACAFKELGPGVLPENQCNAQFVVACSLLFNSGG